MDNVKTLYCKVLGSKESSRKGWLSECPGTRLWETLTWSRWRSKLSQTFLYWYACPKCVTTAEWSALAHPCLCMQPTAAQLCCFTFCRPDRSPRKRTYGGNTGSWVQRFWPIVAWSHHHRRKGTKDRIHRGRLISAIVRPVKDQADCLVGKALAMHIYAWERPYLSELVSNSSLFLLSVGLLAEGAQGSAFQLF